MNARIALKNDKVCNYLEVEYFTSAGQMEGCYCNKYFKHLPNGMAALIYCGTYGSNGPGCWFDLKFQNNT